MNKLLIDYYRSRIKDLKKENFNLQRNYDDVRDLYRKTKEWNDLMDKVIKEVEAA